MMIGLVASAVLHTSLHTADKAVRYIDLEGDAPRDERLGAGDSAVIVPGIEHHVEPSTDAQFYVQFFRESDGSMVPGVDRADSLDRSGPWVHRDRDLDTEQEIVEMVTRQYVDVGLFAEADRGASPPAAL